jgi:hypothetical protein
MYGIALEKGLILYKTREDGFERQMQRKELNMTIEDAHEFMKEHEHDIENLATDGHPLGRAIAVLYDLHMQDPDNTNAANVLALAIEEYRDKMGPTSKDKTSSNRNHLN